jgi:hypothetical protein
LDANQIKELTEYFDTRYVQKDTCSDRHEKTDEKINTLVIDNTKINTKLTIIQWLGGIAAAEGLANLLSKIHEAIFK